jgi:hypothetical protein
MFFERAIVSNTAGLVIILEDKAPANYLHTHTLCLPQACDLWWVHHCYSIRIPPLGYRSGLVER